MERLLNLFAKDPTAGCVERKQSGLSVSVAAKSLNNIAFGDDYQKLSDFGRPDNTRPYKKGRVEYHSLGLIAEFESDKVDYFAFVINDESEKKFEPSRVTVVTQSGSTVELTKQTSVADIKRMFGEPQEVEKYDGKQILAYKQNGLRLEFEGV